jgi:glutamate-5-semialdehyde dehydrogenase
VSICNTLDTLLVHKDVAETFLRKLNPLLVEKNVEVRCDSRALCILKCKKCGHAEGEACDLDPNAPKNLSAATDEDFGKEFLDYILAVKVVDSVDEAIEHITRYSLRHTEAILTSNATTAERFLREVDAACVYWNASTQFSDGAQFGLGAEIGISTQKLHARGPFALEGLTTYKWVVRGEGQVRP